MIKLVYKTGANASINKTYTKLLELGKWPLRGAPLVLWCPSFIAQTPKTLSIVGRTRGAESSRLKSLESARTVLYSVPNACSLASPSSLRNVRN